MQTDKFVVGEVVHSDDFDQSVEIEIVELLEDEDLRIKLTRVPQEWLLQGLQVGQEYVLDHFTIYGKSHWLFQKRLMPMYSLSVEPHGLKTFSYFGS